MRNQQYVTWLRSYAAKRAKLKNNAVPIVVDGGGADPVYYTQHFINAVKSLKDYCMVIQSYDHGFQFRADNLVKVPIGRFMILTNYKAQNEADMIEKIDVCEHEAEQIVAKIHQDFKNPNNSNQVLNSFDLNDVQIEKLFLPDNKCGVGVTFPFLINHSALFLLDNEWD